MELFSINEIVQATNGVVSPQINLHAKIDNISIDSRTVEKNGLFIAIRGENHDGHDYVEKILADASSFALVNRDSGISLPNAIVVEDTTIALGNLSAYYRQLYDIPVVAITGSNGKTTVKEMLRSICDQQYGAEHVLATSGNLNNHWGMPLTMLRLTKQHKVAIIEMGMNHAGELDYLTRLAKPTVAVVNNVMFAHAGHFKGLEDIAAAKGEIYHGLSNTSIACVNITNSFAESWLANDITTQNIFKFGDSSTNCYIQEITADGALYQTHLGAVLIKLNVLGIHNYYNALTAIALALNAGCDLAAIKTGLENYAGYKGRLEQKIAFNGARIIDDTYNANPDSVKAALEAISSLPRPYWFVFADLKELGTQEVLFHQEIGKYANSLGLDKLITVGQLSKYTAEIFAGDKIHFEQNEDVVKYCISHLPNNATVLFKGSNSMKLFDVVAKLIDKK